MGFTDCYAFQSFLAFPLFDFLTFRFFLLGGESEKSKTRKVPKSPEKSRKIPKSPEKSKSQKVENFSTFRLFDFSILFFESPLN